MCPPFSRTRLRAALLVALVTIGVGVMGILYPDSLTALRRSYFATPGQFYTAGAVRLLMGAVLMLAGALVALFSGVFLAVAVIQWPSDEQLKLVH